MTTTAEPVQGDRRATYREVLAEPRFRLLFTTRTVAITADSLRITTFSVLVFTATGSALFSALAFGISFLPQLFGSLLFGSLADRLPPRALIAGGYALECAAAVLLALVRMPIAASLGVVALIALATPLFSGASSRLVARWLEGDAYVLGRSLNNMASSGAQLFGLALGGAAVAVLGAHRALAVSPALYLGCALAVRLRLPRLEPGASGGTSGGARGDGGAVRASLRGAGLLLRGRTVRRLMLAQWLPSAFVAGAEGLIVAYAGGRHFAPGWYAVLMGCLPVGMLIGDLLVGRLLRPPTRERLVVPLVVLMGLPLIGFAAEPGVGVSCALLLLTGSGFAYGLGLQRPFLDALPQDGQGQAFGLLGSGNMTLQGIGPACFGSVAEGIGTGGAIALAGGAAALTAGWILSWRQAP
ncbi:MFS transporter [Streptomyces sp. TR1341]|uniref:MFS transporter n=1 Tax=Streptomyces sp. TR1341 TaxID=2601266 RepID=UPI00138AB367|nr:MFS transporter [Streptomyces sp. TR1341]